MEAIVLSKAGDIDNLKIEKVADPKPKKNEVLIKHQAVGINFFDYGYITGQYKLSKYPAILGIEGCGIITELGSEVKDYKVGDRVVYVNSGLGSFAEKKCVNVQNLILVPDYITSEIAAGTFLKGLMAHTLLFRVYLAPLVKKILIHSAASGVGHILCQWAKYLDLEVIGTVGSDEKIDFARSIGCSYVINYKTQDLVEQVGKITDYGGVGVVYDSIGKETLNKSVECLWSMGLCVSYGEASGNIDNFNLNELVANCLYITRPTLLKYKSIRSELVLGANELFAAINKGVIRPKITPYKFRDFEKAFNDIKNRKTMGSLILTF